MLDTGWERCEGEVKESKLQNRETGVAVGTWTEKAT